jgi:hypothetical protein
MGRAVLYVLYAVILVQFLGGLIAFYRVDPKVLFSSLSLQNGFFLGLFILIHLLGIAGAVLVVVRRRLGFLLSIAHQLLMVLGLKIGTTFVFLTHDAVSIYVFLLSRFDEYFVTWRWSWGISTIFAQLARDPRGTYIGINLFALACAGYLWWAMKEADAEVEEPEWEEDAEPDWEELEEMTRRPQRHPARQAPVDGRQPRRAG